MGARKHNMAQAHKEKRASKFYATQLLPTSPRKMRLVADMIRGMEINKALGCLHFTKNQAASKLEKLLKSAIINWETKNNKKINDETLFVSTITVDEGITIKRLRPAPQGRGYRIRKRSNKVTIFIDSKDANNNNEILAQDNN